jgi:lipopolysaccharide transport system permease protein
VEDKNQYYIGKGVNSNNYWKELWKFKSLFFFLAWRDILLRYKQTAIGVSWSIIRPLITLAVFSIVFGYFAKLPDKGMPYTVLVLSALIPWQLFATSFTEASNSLIANSNILTKVYFPRIIIPASSIISSLVDFLISFFLLILLMLYYHIVPTWRILFIPVFSAIILITSLGASFFVSALNVKYRDFKYIVPVIIQMGLYISPVGYSSIVVPEKYQFIYSLNPMVGVIEGFRWSILGQHNSLNLYGLILSAILGILIFIFGIAYFRKVEKRFVDYI